MFVLCCMFVTTWLISTLRVSCSNHSPLFHTSVAGLKFLHVISPLLTECEVCTGKYLPEVFVGTDRATSVRKNRKQILSHTDRANEAPYSFLKSTKHTFQIQNIVHWYFVRRMKLTVWYRTAFWESETATKKCVTVVAMATKTSKKWLLICV